MSDIQYLETTPCARCGTTKGIKRRTRQNVPLKYRRYSGKRFGFDASLCETCYARALRHARAAAAGRVPGKPGNPWARDARTASAGPAKRASKADLAKPASNASSAKRISPAEVAARLREIEAEKVELGLRAPAGETPVETQQRHWAGLAAAERRSAAASRSIQRKQVAI